MPSEDVQPNELRLNRKGNVHVPLVRTSHPRGAPRGHFRGFPQRGRGYYAGGYQTRPSGPPVVRVGPAQAAGHLPPSASSSTHQYDSGTARGKLTQETHKHERHPVAPKREPSHNNDLQGPPHKVPRTSQYPQNTTAEFNPRRTSNAHRRQEIIVPLPSDCHQGVPYYKYNRERWARDNIQRTAMERGVNIVGHQFFGTDQAKLFYYSLPGDAPLASGSRDVPPPASLPNPASCHQSLPSVSEQLKRLAESPQLAALLQATKNDHIISKVEAHSQTGIEADPSVPEKTDDPHPPSKQPLSTTPVSHPFPKPALPKPRPLKPSPPAASAAPKPEAPAVVSSIPRAAPICKPEPSDIIDLTLSSDDVPKHEPEVEVIPSSPQEDIYEEDELAGDYSSPPPEVNPSGKRHVSVPAVECLLVTSGTLTLDREYGMNIKGSASKSIVRRQQPGTSVRGRTSSPEIEVLDLSPSPAPSGSLGGAPGGDHGTHPDRVSSQPGSQEARPREIVDETAELQVVEWAERGEAVVRAPFNNYDKPRRLLTGSSRGLVTVSMRGAVDLVSWKSKKRSTLLQASERSGDLVDDACILRTIDDKTYALLAHARDRKQLSLLRVRTSDEPPAPIFLTRPSERGSTNTGASVVCAMLQPGAFATGGYDHKVHLWDVPSDVTEATARELPIRHSSCVHALLPVRDTSHKLLSAGADCRVSVYELASERVVHAFKVSNAVYHLHDAGLPYCALLEVAHRELQFEIRDYRMVPERPVQRFGFNMELLQGRHAKGDVKDFYFAAGDREGNVRLWDIRKADKPVSIVNCFPGHRTVQVAFRGQELVVCSDDLQVKFLGPASD